MFNRKRMVLNLLNEATGVLEGSGYIIQEMQRHKNYGKLVRLRMDLLRQKKFLETVKDYITTNCK